MPFAFTLHPFAEDMMHLCLAYLFSGKIVYTLNTE